MFLVNNCTCRGDGVGGSGLSLLRWLGLVGSLARGPLGSVFFSAFRGAPESYGTDTSASTSPLERYRVNLLAQNLPHLSRQRPEMPQPLN